MTRAVQAAMREDEVDIYLRISFDKGGQEFGVDRQEKACRELCTRMGWKVRHVWPDNSKSATKGKRPKFEEMILARPRMIVMWSVDRLVRKGEDLERLIKLDVPVHSVQAGPMDLATASGRLNARLLTSVATFEGEMKAERQAAANKQRAHRGDHWWPGRPFGLEMDGSLRESEAAIVRECYDKLLAGASIAGMARHLNERGIPTSRGGKWHPASVRDLLEAARNAGIRTYRGEEVGKGNWEAIIPEDVYRKAMRLMTQPGRCKRPVGVVRKHLLTALATCGKCGGPMKIQRNNATRRLMYQCRFRWCAAIDQDWLDRYVRRAAKGILMDAASTHVWAADSTTDVHALRALVETCEREMEEYVEDRKAGLLDRSAFNELYGATRDRRDAAKEKLDQAKGVSPVSAIVESGDVATAWDRLTLSQERAAIEWLLPVITVLPRGKGVRSVKPEDVILRHRGEVPEEAAS